MSANKPTNNPNLVSKGREIYKTLPRWAKWIIGLLSASLLLLAMAWCVLAWYINTHKKELLAKITAQVSETVDGNFHIADIEPALLKNFPNVSVRLVGITLSDSLFHKHKKNLADIGSVFVKLNTLSLLTQNPKVKKITIADGSIYLFQAKDGYSNTYLLKPNKKDSVKGGKSKEPDIDDFGIENVTFTFDHFERNKQFKVRVDEMNGHIGSKGDVVNVQTESKVHFYQLGFNLAKGGFIKNKDLKAPLHFTFNKKTSTLKLPLQRLNINGTNLSAAINFVFAKPTSYAIYVDAPAIGFKEGVSCLSRAIAAKLDSFDLANDLAVRVHINGSFQYPDTPLVHAYWQTTHNTLQTALGAVANASFKGEFYNYYVPGHGRGDDNSAIIINDLSASFQEIPFAANSIVIYGLINPLMKLKLKSKFDVAKLNNILGNSFDFNQGNADIDLNYTGPVLASTTQRHTMYGHIRIGNGAMTYVPRNLSFKHCNINIEFAGEDLFLRNTSLSSVRSTVQLDGVARNFMNVYFLDPGKVVFDWQIKSNKIDLTEFKSLIAPRQAKKSARNTNKNRKIQNISDRLSQVLDKSSMYLHVNVAHLIYDHFDAQQIKADIDLEQTQIGINNASLNHAGGTAAGSATILTNAANLPFKLNATVNNVQIGKLFFAFDNFGQNTLSTDNLKGAFSAKVNLAGALTAAGNLVPRSVNGNVNFELKNGELNNFRPFESIGKLLFKKRHLEHITFNDIKNNMDIAAGKINIAPMSIESSALTMKVEGTYAFDKGTDLSIAVPLRNPYKDKEKALDGNKPQKDKGVILYLRARDGDDGQVKITWDPLKKGVKGEDAQPMLDEEETEKEQK
ncbi:MAG: AsmA-like C-terminal region-containing protein [Edaphocola sp.]